MLEFTHANRREPYGSALTIQLPRKLDKNETTQVSIEYETTEQCTAIQWLNPRQTFGGKHPFLYVNFAGKHSIEFVGSRSVKPSTHDLCCHVKIPHLSKRHSKLLFALLFVSLPQVDKLQAIRTTTAPQPIIPRNPFLYPVI